MTLVSMVRVRCYYPRCGERLPKFAQVTGMLLQNTVNTIHFVYSLVVPTTISDGSGGHHEVLGIKFTVGASFVCRKCPQTSSTKPAIEAPPFMQLINAIL